MNQLTYVMVKGHRSDSALLFVPQEQHLYVKKCERFNKTEYICYQTILCKSSSIPEKCTSRVQIKNGICTRKRNGHTTHDNHKIIYNDLITRHKINDACIALKDMSKDLCISVPDRKIFTRELAR